MLQIWILKMFGHFICWTAAFVFCGYYTKPYILVRSHFPAFGTSCFMWCLALSKVLCPEYFIPCVHFIDLNFTFNIHLYNLEDISWAFAYEYPIALVPSAEDLDGVAFALLPANRSFNLCESASQFSILIYLFMCMQ